MVNMKSLGITESQNVVNKSYLAAPNRKRLSPLARKILNLGFLANNESHLDYGCGYGQDVQNLRSLGFNSVGYV